MKKEVVEEDDDFLIFEIEKDIATLIERDCSISDYVHITQTGEIVKAREVKLYEVF